ncbi:uncharacterized protein [Nicotiana sylvestris]|uniref:uncharacterized protein isoform X2 n=1 Tax=Nicotiana sylvestris TaxID=4096 RepID=UPI00388CDDC1
MLPSDLVFPCSFYSVSLRNNHSCVENSMRHHCPICYEIEETIMPEDLRYKKLDGGSTLEYKDHRMTTIQITKQIQSTISFHSE